MNLPAFLPWLLALALAVALAIVAGRLRRERRARSALEATLAREARHDLATALPNRRFLQEWLGYALAQARREGRELGLLMIDVRGDDRVRHAVALRLQALKREGDLLATVEAGVFALVATAAPRGEELRSLGERLLREAAAAAPHAPVPVANVGIALFPDDADDLPGLVAAADSALASARRSGPGNVAFHRADGRA